MTPIKRGEPFIMAVQDGNLDGTVEVVNDNLGASVLSEEHGFVRSIMDGVQGHGGGVQVYLCVPIGRIWTDNDGDQDDASNAPDRVVTVDMTEPGIERMAAIAAVL